MTDELTNLRERGGNIHRSPERISRSTVSSRPKRAMPSSSQVLQKRFRSHRPYSSPSSLMWNCGFRQEPFLYWRMNCCSSGARPSPGGWTACCIPACAARPARCLPGTTPSLHNSVPFHSLVWSHFSLFKKINS